MANYVLYYVLYTTFIYSVYVNIKWESWRRGNVPEVTSRLVNLVRPPLTQCDKSLAHKKEYPCSSKERLLGIVSVWHYPLNNIQCEGRLEAMILTICKAGFSQGRSLAHALVLCLPVQPKCPCTYITLPISLLCTKPKISHEFTA